MSRPQECNLHPARICTSCSWRDSLSDGRGESSCSRSGRPLTLTRFLSRSPTESFSLCESDIGQMLPFFVRSLYFLQFFNSFDFTSILKSNESLSEEKDGRTESVGKRFNLKLEISSNTINSSLELIVLFKIIYSII